MSAAAHAVPARARAARPALLSPRLTGATAERVLHQVRGDRRSLAMVLLLPAVLLAIVAWVYDGTATFDRIGPAMLALFPFTVMFLLTSVTTLRERQTGTLERLLTTPLGKADLVLGYGLAFGVLAVGQAVVAVAVSVGLLGLDVRGPLLALLLVAVVDGVLGTALGLLASAFAATELQAVQMMPAVVLPQVLLCGLLLPRDLLPDGLRRAVEPAAAQPRGRRHDGGRHPGRRLGGPRRPAAGRRRLRGRRAGGRGGDAAATDRLSARCRLRRPAAPARGRPAAPGPGSAARPAGRAPRPGPGWPPAPAARPRRAP